MNQPIFLGLGSNIGDRLGFLQDALGTLRVRGCEIVATSSVYESPPWGNIAQPPFLNAVVQIRFDQTPFELLDLVRETEEALGRVRGSHWGPRSIDVDILSFGDLHLSSQRLYIPHPMLAQRAFVLVPWAEIAPDFIVPTHETTVQKLRDRLPIDELRTISKLEFGKL